MTPELPHLTKTRDEDSIMLSFKCARVHCSVQFGFIPVSHCTPRNKVGEGATNAVLDIISPGRTLKDLIVDSKVNLWYIPFNQHDEFFNVENVDAQDPSSIAAMCGGRVSCLFIVLAVAMEGAKRASSWATLFGDAETLRGCYSKGTRWHRLWFDTVFQGLAGAWKLRPPLGNDECPHARTSNINMFYLWVACMRANVRRMRF